MKVFILGGAIGLLLSGCGGGGVLGGGMPIHGTWVYAEKYTGRNVTAKLKFEPDSVTVMMECRMYGNRANASVSGKAEITDKEIKILEDKSDVQRLEVSKGYSIECPALLRKKIVTYEFQGDTLIVSSNGKSAELTRSN